ncbi:MAG: hypothetical protein ACMG55_13750 [Microcoleus sp.]
MKKYMASDLEFRRFTFDGDYENPGALRIEKAHDDEIQPIILELKRTADRLNAYPHNEDGLNKERIRRFLGGYGLRMKDFSAFNNVEMMDVRVALGAEVDSAAEYGGAYVPSCDFTFVSRAMEENNGSEFTEALAVHELTHAEMKAKKYMYFPQSKEPAKSLMQLRGGFEVEGKYEHISGNFFEEGLAELMAQFYMRDELKKSEGFTDYRHTFNIEHVIIPSKLLYNSSKDSFPDWSIGAPSFAAYGMSLLIAKDPEIFTNMLDSRKENDVEVFREFAQKIERLSPGLYIYLRDREYSQGGFSSGVTEIIQRLYSGDYEAALRASSVVL